MRLVLFAGPGDASTATAATATLLAARGVKTLVVSADPAGGLADVLGAPFGPEPNELDTGLTVLQVDPLRAFEWAWGRAGPALTPLFAAGRPVPGELPVPPGAAEVLALAEVRNLADTGRYDAIVVDAGPAEHALRMLALPETLAWYIEQVAPTHLRMLHAAAMPAGAAEDLSGVASRVHHALARLQALLAAGTSSLRLVVRPDRAGLASLRSTLTRLALLGHQVDGVLASGVLPAGAATGWAAEEAAAQRAVLVQLRTAVPGVPVRSLPYRAVAPVGLPELLDVGTAVYGDDDVLAVPPPAQLVAVERDGGEYVLRVSLPFVDRAAVRLARSGDDLVVTVGAARRLLPLPSGLRRCEAVSARVADGVLRVRFRPDPDLWPRTSSGGLVMTPQEAR